MKKRLENHDPEGKKLLPLAAILALSLSYAPAFAGETGVNLEPVRVKAAKDAGILENDVEETSTKTVIPKQTINTLAGPAQTNPFKALDLLPSVHSEGSDAFGLVVDQNPLRIRGQIGDNFTRLSRTIEGLPLGVNVGQSSMGNFIDLENIAEISLIRGAVPASKGFGFGNSAGALDQLLLLPANKFGITLKQSVGSEHFQRTFGRLDTGKLGHSTRLFGSLSYSGADKWRGSGDAERSNFSLGLTQELPGDNHFTLYGVYNTFLQFGYKPLTYAQASNDSYLRNYDYNANRTGNALNNTNYYGYNKQKFNEYAVMGKLELKPSSSTYAVFKPYYAATDGYRLFGSGTTVANSVINRTDITQEQVGFTTEFGVNLGPSTLKVGYWYQDIDTMPPPTGQKSYTLTANGLTFKGWSMLTRQSGREFHAPYVELDNKFGKFRVNAGVKYINIGLPSITGYNTAGLPDVSYSEIFAYNPTAKSGMSVSGATFEDILPYFGASYEFKERSLVRLNYGRNYAEPWQGPLYSTYNSNAAAFQTAGISLQDLWKKMKLEISDNVDLGVRYDGGFWYVAPTGFYGRYYDKQVMVYDSKVNLSYYQSNATAEAMGAELEVGVTPLNGLTIFGSASYNHFTYCDNIKTASSTTVMSRGKQVADSPEFMGKLGVSYTWRGFNINPVVRYIGERYGDIENKERIAPYTVVDLNLGYVLKKVWGFNEISTSLSIQNLFNEKYVGIIKNDQDASQALATTYYPGAPLTVVGSLGLKF